MANSCLSCTKNGVFFSAASCKKDTLFGAAQTKLGPSYFFKALVQQVQTCADLSRANYLLKIVLVEYARKLDRESDMKKIIIIVRPSIIALLLRAYYGRKESVLYFRFRCLYDRISGM